MDGGGGASGVSSNPTGLGAGTKPLSSANYAGNSGRNTVGHAKDGKSGDFDKGRDNSAKGNGAGKDKKKPLYGFQSSGTSRSKVPKEAKQPKTKKKVRLETEEAQPDKPVESKKQKINHKTSDIATTGKLSHSRVGVPQKMASFGSHRRSHNWIQPGVAKAQLIGPFSDHMHFKQRRPLY